VVALIDALLLVAAAAVAVPCLVFASECLLSLLPRRDASRRLLRTLGSQRPRTAVLVPAHDEEALIAATVQALLPELGPEDRLIIVADNCSDETADRAREAGASVIERSDPSNRGKGFALAFGVEHLAADPPDVVIVIDADCRVSSGAVERLAREAFALGRPVQADYLIEPPPDPAPLAVVSGFALLVRNRVRPSGLARIGMPCNLVGSGMSLPWELMRRARATGDNLVEDLAMSFDLALQGFPARYCPDARVTSTLPERDEAAEEQRRRWEHGQMATLIENVPRLFFAGLARRRPELVALGLDLGVPPLALLCLLMLGMLGVSGLGLVLGLSALPLQLLLGCGALMTLGVRGAWLKYGLALFPPRYVLSVPVYLLWKIPLYLSFLGGSRQRAWVRTERDTSDAADASDVLPPQPRESD
jgi:cellulose synthase/poly-beta-1,6-N-acetylglucosamine synthase-like glycosyltransferase